jgi:hypothetical protein
MQRKIVGILLLISLPLFGSAALPSDQDAA